MNPVINLIAEDASVRIGMELDVQKLTRRVEIVEHTVFGKQKRPETVIEQM